MAGKYLFYERAIPERDLGQIHKSANVVAPVFNGMLKNVLCFFPPLTASVE